jgi:hypothetical protein
METMSSRARESGAEILEKQMPIHPERFIEHRATDMWR